MERELFVLLISIVDSLPEFRHRPAKARFTDRDIVLVWMWAVLHDRPIDWACKRQNWPWHDRKRPLPSGSTMSRRLRTESVRRLGPRVLEALRVPSTDPRALLLMDGKPLPVSGISADRDVRYGRACGVMARGYKLHSITDSAGNHRVFEVMPLNVNEVKVAKTLLVRLPMTPNTRMLADGNYDCNELYDLAAARGVQLIAARRRRHARGMGHHSHSPHRLRAIRMRERSPRVLSPRRLIEGHFGTMGNVVGGLAPLPNHVRGLERVSRWVTAKLIIDALHRARRSRLRAA
jgi:Transposase DDE domain